MCHTISMEEKETTMKNQTQPKWFAVFTTHCKYLVFDVYEDAWKYAQKVYEETGNVVAVEAIN